MDSNAQFVEPGYLVFAKDGTLVAQRFDPAAGEVTGRLLPVADSVSFFLSTGTASFATSSRTLVYQPQRNRDRIAWVDRSGKDLGAVGVAGDYLGLRLASAGRFALLTRALPATGTYDIWSLDLERGGETRVTLDDRGTEIDPVLLRGGRTLIFSATTAGGPPQLFRKNVDTGEDEAILAPTEDFRDAYDVTPDGRLLGYGEFTKAGSGLWAVPLDAPRTPSTLQLSRSATAELRFSPDGRYYIFTSHESGRSEVYVASLAGGGKQPVSAGGARLARWSPDGREILYLSSDARVVSVPVRLAPSLELGKPETLFTLKGKPWIDFDVAPDKRLLAVIREVVAEEQPLTARLHWSPGDQKVAPCHFPRAPDSARTRSSRQLAPAAWARCTPRGIAGSIAPLQSRHSPPASPDSPDARQRFEREAKAISRLSHPHICALYDVGHEGDVEYLVMELLEGETLARRLTKGPLPIAQVLRYGREIADALAAAHRQGIVHRDLKPGNVMLTSSGVKLLDFGLAKTTSAGGPVDGAEASTAALPASLTADGTLLGTAPYMAPEQIQGQPADARSDIFALGAVLYEMATGRRAFAGATAMAIAGSILHEDPPSLSEMKVPVPPAFEPARAHVSWRRIRRRAGRPLKTLRSN